MIFCNYNYQNYHNENKERHPIQPYHWNNWVKMVNANKRYCCNFNIFQWVVCYFWYLMGRFRWHELPSEHPYWRLSVKKKLRARIKFIERQYRYCKKHPEKIPYIFNKWTTLEDIESKIKALKKKLK